MEIKEKIIEFLQKNYPVCRLWTTLPEYLDWFFKHECYGLVGNEHGEVTGFALARPVEKPEDGRTHYHFDPLGSCLYVDLCIATTKEAEKKLFEVIYMKAGKPTLIAFKKSGKDRAHYFDKFMKRYLNKEKIGNSDVK